MAEVEEDYRSRLKYASKHICQAYEKVSNQKCSVGQFVLPAFKSMIFYF